MRKFYLKFRKIKSQMKTANNTLIFVSVDPPGSCSIPVYVLKFFSANSLWGAFFDWGYLKVLQVKLFFIVVVEVH